MIKKAQAWGFDLIIGTVIFALAIAGFYVYALNSPVTGVDTLDYLTKEGETLSGILLSEGYPSDWNEMNVVRPGLTSSNKINETKLEKFNTLSTNEYDRVRSLFRTKFNYYLNFSDPIVMGGSQIEGIGRPPQNARNVIKTTRFTIYKDRPVTFNLYIWGQ